MYLTQLSTGERKKKRLKGKLERVTQKRNGEGGKENEREMGMAERMRKVKCCVLITCLHFCFFSCVMYTVSYVHTQF